LNLHNSISKAFYSSNILNSTIINFDKIGMFSFIEQNQPLFYEKQCDKFYGRIE